MPKHSPEMNRIEEQWLHLKRDELQGRVYGDEYELVLGIMAKYILFGSYCQDALEKRTPYRQEHLDELARQKEQGLLITLGPTKDNTKVFGIYEAENQEVVEQLIESDPYWQNGIWIEYEIKEWIQAF